MFTDGEETRPPYVAAVSADVLAKVSAIRYKYTVCSSLIPFVTESYLNLAKNAYTKGF